MRHYLLVAIVALAIPITAQAHKPSDSYLNLEVDGEALHGQWDLSLRDLDRALGLDTDGDGAITWGELRDRTPVIDAYVQARLAIASDGRGCPLRLASPLVDRHTDGVYAVLRFSAACPAAPGRLAVEYGAFFDLDPQHRGLLRVERGGVLQTAIFAPDARRQELAVAGGGPWQTLVTYLGEGVRHIAIGYDHILFLLSLLLPAVLFRKEGRWLAVDRLRPACADVLRIVTAFTAAHSVTLSLATLGFVELPSRWVESAIAASVVLAALNNLWPIADSRLWVAAFGFGLVHGLGFASVLRDLGLSGGSLWPSLLGFNLGVEAGQLAIVAAFLPLAFVLRGSLFYRRYAVGAGSIAIALVATVWLVERSLDVRIVTP